MKTAFLLLLCAPAAVAQFREAPKPLAGVTPPRLLHRVEADYSAEARSKGLEGTSTLAMEIGANGTPCNIKVVKALDPALDAKAVQALAQWRFRPAFKDGMPVSITATVEFRFRRSKFAVLQDPELQTPADPIPDNELLWW